MIDDKGFELEVVMSLIVKLFADILLEIKVNDEASNYSIFDTSEFSSANSEF